MPLQTTQPKTTETQCQQHSQTKISPQTVELGCTGWIPDEELERLYRTSRLAVFPLRYGAGVKGKVIEAMMWGLPVVGSGAAFEGTHIPAQISIVSCAELTSAWFPAIHRMLTSGYNEKERRETKAYLIKTFMTSDDLLN